MQQQRIALVSGASRGIGAAIALNLASKGITVIGTATSSSGADSIATNLAATNSNSTGLVLNIASSASVEQLMQAINDKYNASPSILINNAGITKDDLFLRMDEAKWHEVINTNLTGMYRLCRACMRPMLKSRWGRIVNISSVVAATGNPGQTNYVAAKAGMVGFTKALALEVASRNITVNAVAPGFIATDMTNNLMPEQKDAINRSIPVNRMGQPEDIAHTVDFLVSEQASYITGTVLHVNGGMFLG